MFYRKISFLVLTMILVSSVYAQNNWTNATGNWYANYGGYWYVDWVIPGSATTGLYDVIVEVSDSDGGSASVNELGEFNITP